MDEKRTGSRKYRVFAQIRRHENTFIARVPQVIDHGLPYRRALLVLDINQKVWEGLGANVQRTRVMVEADTPEFIFRVWIEKE